MIVCPTRESAKRNGVIDWKAAGPLNAVVLDGATWVGASGALGSTLNDHCTEPPLDVTDAV